MIGPGRGAPIEIEPAVKAVLDSVAYLIKRVDKEILKYQRQLGLSLGKILDGTAKVNDYLYVGFSATLAIIGALTAVSSAGWAQMARASITVLKTGIATFLDMFGVAFLISAHRILAQFLPAYNQLFTGVYDAVAGISESLGMGLAFIPAVLLDAQNIAVNLATLFGADPDVKRFEFLSDAAEWVKKLDDNFTKYARDPGLILSDLQESIIRNSQLEASESWKLLQDDITEIRTKAILALQSVDGVVSSFAALVGNLPDETFERVHEILDPFIGSYIRFRDERIIPALEVLEESLLPLTELIDSEVEKGKRNGYKAIHSLEIIARFIAIGDKVENRAREMMRFIIERIRIRLSSESARSLNDSIQGAHYPLPIAPPQLVELEPGSFTETVGRGGVIGYAKSYKPIDPTKLSDGIGFTARTGNLISRI